MDIKNLTLREALQIFDEQRHKAGTSKYSPTAKGYTKTATMFEKRFPDLMDVKGGAMLLFTPDKTGEFPASILAKSLYHPDPDQSDLPKSLMQEMRYLGADFLRKNLPRNDPDISILPVKDTAEVESFFGVPEPAKGGNEVIPNSNPEAHGKFLAKLEEYKVKNPSKKAIVDAIILNLIQGVRPSVAQKLDVGKNYNVKRMTLRIPGEGQGAKGAAFSTPLSDYADLLIQENIKNNKKIGVTGTKVFNIIGKNGKPRVISDTDVLNVLSEINVVISGELDPTTGIIRGSGAEGLVSDPDQIDPITGEKGVTYASYNPPAYEGRRAGGKFGAQLMRNLNTDAGAGVIDVSAGAIIQGRDIKQVYIGKKTGAMSVYVGYQKDPFRSFTDFDGNPDEFRQGANTIVDRLFQSAEKHGGLDLTNTYYGQLSGTTAASRITADTPGYSDYFKTATEKDIGGVPTIKLPPKTTDAIADGNPKNMSQKLIDLILKNKSKLSSIATITAAGGAAGYSLVSDATEFAKETAIDIGAEAGAKMLGLGTKIAGAAGMMVYPPMETGKVPAIERPEYNTIRDMAMQPPPKVEDETQPPPPSADEQTYNFLTQQN